MSNKPDAGSHGVVRRVAVVVDRRRRSGRRLREVGPGGHRIRGVAAAAGIGSTILATASTSAAWWTTRVNC